MVTTSPAFLPVVLEGVTVDPTNPFKFNFILNKGDAEYEEEALEKESTQLVKYFLTALTVPEDELWVNLSPYEKDRIIPDTFGQTEMGQDLLAQDYILKQLTASLMYPEDELGERFWSRIYEKLYAQYPNQVEKISENIISADTFNKVWIIPKHADIYVNENTAFIVKSELKVMLESDYVAAQHNDIDKETLPIASEVIKEIVIPAIEQEVNNGEHFARLRQVYNSIILAAWYKQELKDSLLGKVYADKNKALGLFASDRNAKEKIYKQYVDSFEKGVYNYIKEEYDPDQQQIVPKRYFSGGTSFKLSGKNSAMSIENNRQLLEEFFANGVPVGLDMDAILLAFEKRNGGERFYVDVDLKSMDIVADIKEILVNYGNKNEEIEKLFKAIEREADLELQNVYMKLQELLHYDMPEEYSEIVLDIGLLTQIIAKTGEKAGDVYRSLITLVDNIITREVDGRFLDLGLLKFIVESSLDLSGLENPDKNWIRTYDEYKVDQMERISEDNKVVVEEQEEKMPSTEYNVNEAMAYNSIEALKTARNEARTSLRWIYNSLNEVEDVLDVISQHAGKNEIVAYIELEHLAAMIIKFFDKQGSASDRLPIELLKDISLQSGKKAWTMYMELRLMWEEKISLYEESISNPNIGGTGFELDDMVISFDEIMQSLSNKGIKIRSLVGVDASMKSNEKVVVSEEGENVGGINLSYDQLNLNVDRGSNVKSPLFFEGQDSNDIHIDGLVPIITNMVPIMSLPLLLGFIDVEGNPVSDDDIENPPINIPLYSKKELSFL